MNNFWNKLYKPFTVLAPMENVTDFVFREIMSKELPKPDVMFTEFTNVDALSSSGYEKTIHRFKFSNKQHPIVAQIWGTNPEHFTKAAQIAEKFGFDGIDINMGCPVRAVIKNGACSALINNRPLVKEIIKATRNGTKKLPISVKTRIGFKEIQTEDWITFLLEQKIDALTIHCRTAKQMSDVPANWEEITKVVEIRNKISPKTIIVGNGDVKSYKEVLEKYKIYNIDGVMIGRGIFSNPWVFEKTNKKHEFAESKLILIKHLKLCGNEYSDHIKKFYKMYIRGAWPNQNLVNNFDGANKLRSELMTTKTVEEALQLLK